MLAFAGGAAAALMAAPSAADSLDTKDFSLRFPASMGRFSSYADVAASGGASAGSKWQSSVNPASTAWEDIPGMYQLSLNPQYSAIVFGEGATLHVISESVTKDAGESGSFQVTGAQVRSNRSTTRQGLQFSYDMDYLQLQWGKRFSDSSLGINFNYASSSVTNRLGGLRIADSDSDTYGIRGGFLQRLGGDLLGGAVIEYAWSPSRTTLFDVFGSGAGDLRLRDTTEQFSVRLGPSYEYAKDSTLNLDYQYCLLENDTGKFGLHRVFAGIDHRISDAFFLRGGLVVDDHGTTSWTGGVGIYPLKGFSLDLAYQYNMFPELRPELGRAHTATVSLGVTL